ncbi:hypothetical protein VTI28DRAFT_8659 [Corynascus sepedonium]
MAGGGPGANSRGRGGKFKKYTRGGGHHFSRDLRPLDADGNEISMWAVDAQQKRPEDDSEEGSEEEEESSEEESDDDGAGPSSAQSQAAAELSREERRREKKARKEAAIARAKKPVEVGDLPPSASEEEDEEDDNMPANPNHSRKARNQTKVSSVDEAAEAVQKLTVAPSRREREAMEAAAAKERYRKLHEAGKTDQAKEDLARLKLIREKREAEAARKQAEKEEKEALIREKRAEIEAREAKRREAALGPKKANKKK